VSAYTGSNRNAQCPTGCTLANPLNLCDRALGPKALGRRERELHRPVVVRGSTLAVTFDSKQPSTSAPTAAPTSAPTAAPTSAPTPTLAPTTAPSPPLHSLQAEEAARSTAPLSTHNYYADLEFPLASGTFVDSPTFFTHYSAFAGIGTFALLFKLLGGECVGGCEIDEPTAQIFERECPLVSRRRPRLPIVGHRLATALRHLRLRCALPDLLGCRPQGW
jgi:hypothetical protein